MSLDPREEEKVATACVLPTTVLALLEQTCLDRIFVGIKVAIEWILPATLELRIEKAKDHRLNLLSPLISKILLI